MRRMHEYKGWRFGLTALVQDGRWTARIEVYEPGRPSREQSPTPLRFATKASSEEGILVLARKHAEDWIKRLMGQDLIALWAEAMVMVEEGVAPHIIARKVKDTNADIRDFRELTAAALVIACLESAPEGLALPEGITVEQLTDESWQRGRDARKLAALWMELSR